MDGGVVTKGDYYQAAVATGITMVIPIWKFYLAPLFDLGNTLIYGVYGNDDSTSETWFTYPSLSFQMAMGFTTSHFYLGAWLFQATQWGPFEDVIAEQTYLREVNFQTIATQLKLYAGVRF